MNVVVDGHRHLQEYPDPTGEEHDENQRMTRYVEVKAGQTFAVEVSLQPGFHFQGAPFVEARLRVDQEKKLSIVTYEYCGLNVAEGKLRSPKTAIFKARAVRDQVTGSWYRSAYEFGALGVSQLTRERSTWSMLMDRR